jgi:hypothetical protein
VIRVHQPGSEPIDIPETIPNPIVVPTPTPTPTEPAPKEPVRIPEKVPHAGRDEACGAKASGLWSQERKAHPDAEALGLKLRSHSQEVHLAGLFPKGCQAIWAIKRFVARSHAGAGQIFLCLWYTA